MAKGENLVIHTDASYAPDLDVDLINKGYSIDLLYNEAYTYLLEQEQNFYNQFFPDKRISSIDGFIAEIRKLLNEAEKDKACLEKMTNTELSKFLPDAEPSFFESGYKLIIKGTSQKIKTSFKNANVEILDDLYIDIIPENIQEIKSFLNMALNRKGRGRFDERSGNTTNLISTLKNKNYSDLFEITGGTAPKSAPKQQEFNIKEVTKGKYKKEEIQKALENPSEASKLRMEARKSLYKMKEFLFSRLSGSNELRESAEETWKEIFPSVGDDILTRDFFFEGGNYIKSLLGQGGEFYNEVLLRYIGKKTNHPILSKIIGSTIKNGQQPRSDLQIMLDCGAKINFQTKNINDKQPIDVKTTAALIQPNFGDEFVSPLVNYFTNADYESVYGNILTEVEEILSSHFFNAMNLNVQSGLDELQTNTFYFVGGNKIIPGSEIIKDIKSKSEKDPPKFIVKGGRVSKYSNTEYKENWKKFRYWQYEKGSAAIGSNMIPTKRNAPNFNKAAAAISISTSFSINALINGGRFEIFK